MLLAQITDLHIGVEFHDAPAGFSPLQWLTRAIQTLNAMTPRPDIVLLTGDLTADGQLAEYRDLQGALRALEMPFYMVPGNHDNRQNMLTVFSDNQALQACTDPLKRCDQVIDWHDDAQNVRLIGLDTLVPGDHSGRIDQACCEWLKTTLAQRSDCRHVLFLHHPPFVSHMPIFDAMRCQTEGHLEAVLQACTNPVELVLCGHVHRAVQTIWCGALTVALPSVSFQYPLLFDASGQNMAPVFEPGVVGLYQIKAGQKPVAHQLQLTA